MSDMCRYPSQPQPQHATSISDTKSLLPVEITEHPACTEALALARSSLPTSVFNHSFRVFTYARLALPHLADSNAHAFSTTSALADAYKADPERFEVAGANVAADLLRRHGADDDEAREAWLAIAMHTSPQVAEGAGGLIKALRLGVRADFGTYTDLEFGEFEDLLPRLGVEKELGDAVVEQAVALSSKAPGGSWPRDLVRAEEAEPEWEGVNRAF